MTLGASDDYTSEGDFCGSGGSRGTCDTSYVMLRHLSKRLAGLITDHITWEFLVFLLARPWTSGLAFFLAAGATVTGWAQAIGQAAIQQGYRVLYRETHALLDDLAEATLDGTRKEHMEFLVTVPLLILDDLGMRKLPLTAAEELLRSLCAATSAPAPC